MSFPPGNHDDIPEFFRRSGLDRLVWMECCALLRSRILGSWEVKPVSGQGGCSYTLLCCSVADRSSRLSSHTHEGDEDADDDGRHSSVIVQFRLPQHRLSSAIALDARTIYGPLAPHPLWFADLPALSEASASGSAVLQVCAMSALGGIPFSRVVDLPVCHVSDLARYRTLMRDLARFFARGWRAAVASTAQPKLLTGRVGSSILPRLEKLERGLPWTWLRDRACRVRRAVARGGLDVLPAVLSHGDFLPSNVLVAALEDWRLVGVVDWAEAEVLPFGMTLYGVEHFLGRSVVRRADGGKKTTTTTGFVYFDEADEVREMFGMFLRDEIREIGQRGLWDAVILARDVGILLWHGIAWDGGALDRVVGDGPDDAEELRFLEEFLQTGRGIARSKI